MRRAISSMITMGIGAAAYSLRDRRTRKRMQQMIRPLTETAEEIIPKRTIKRMRKRIAKAMS